MTCIRFKDNAVLYYEYNKKTGGYTLQYVSIDPILKSDEILFNDSLQYIDPLDSFNYLHKIPVTKIQLLSNSIICFLEPFYCIDSIKEVLHIFNQINKDLYYYPAINTSKITKDFKDLNKIKLEIENIEDIFVYE